ncbi:RagB/SusD family nutrient uptake outer membrane protein [Pararcticibacter amylolyticus]|uniref:RagB/SusD family nutrient uptake outer membrane protein n=1 Tax=Pararcticibacter amylolyticus TaxID=2173175 RepID=A0A2U2PAY2_9SPHI|nr:RagB/SusD family nutrient uptake outer membrane protein [Pararcticibacter amylolyticus]PWG78547.1 RagB/SusD family nutrient uptake outer membrane protein [Pararcticibacter amylolyticus]
MKKLFIYLLLPLLILGSCTKLDQEFYSQVTPGTFFKSEKDILAALNRPFTHARWYVGEDRWYLQEHTADNFAITTKGPHWENGGENKRYHYHSWTPDDGWIWGSWRGTLMGIALALDARSDLEKLDYSKFALTTDDQQAHINQLNTLIAYFYMRGLDFFGGLPIFNSLEGENLPRNTDQEVFAHIEQLLKTAIEKLPPKSQLDEPAAGELKQAAAAAMLAELYFNAEVYIGRPMYQECQQLSQDIIDGKYGPYQLDATWYGPHSFKNDRSPEIIWSIPSEFNKLQYDWFYSSFYHYNSREYFGQDMGANNGTHMTPSRRPDSTLYRNEWKLGSPFEKFDNGDLRKKPYRYLGSSNYEGMFLVGEQRKPDGGVINGTQEYDRRPLFLRDQVGRFSEVGPGKKYSSVAQLPSNMSEGEENTGVRLVKVPIPTLADNSLRWGADNPVIRLTEIYYMLAECKWRRGDIAGAAGLINTVRKRNFVNGADPNPVLAANFDKYRFIDEWSIEFLGEGRRRTDLLRWNMFTTEKWWDHNPSGSDHLKRFPVPTQAISGNNNLQQNPGY